jgi:hypothetical protein
MTQDEFQEQIARITSAIAGKPLDAELAGELNARFPAGGTDYQAIFDACRAAVAAGWMCDSEAGGIRYGRVIKSGAATDGFSVDVVDMTDVAGPHHRHPNGEIDLVMPLTDGVQFDGQGTGWVVYGPDSAHRPTVSNGRALVLYLLPGGAIEFTRP